MADAKFSESKFHDITHCGLRVAIGAVFIAHGSPKFNPGFSEFLAKIGLPVELQVPVALLETIGGILLIIGFFTRTSASLLSIEMLGAIFYVKHAANLTGQGGVELELMLLAGSLIIIAIGPGRVSISHIAKKIPRFLQ